MIETNGERGLWKFVLAAAHNDNDRYIHKHTWESYRRIMVEELDCDPKVSYFEIHLHNYIYSRINNPYPSAVG